MKLQSKLFFPLLPLYIAPLLIFAFIAYSYLHNSTRTMVMQQMDTLLNHTQTNLQDQFSHLQANGRLFANSHLIRSYVTTPVESRYQIMQPAVIRLLKTYTKAYPEYADIRIILPNGDIDTQVQNGNPILPQEYHKLIANIVFNNPKQTTQLVSGHNAIYLVHAQALDVRDKPVEPTNIKSKTRGYLITTLDWSKQIKSGLNAKLGATGHLLFTNQAGMQLSLNTDTLSQAPLFDNDLNLYSYRNVDKILNIYAVLPIQELTDKASMLGNIAIGIIILVVAATSLLLYYQVKYTLIIPINSLKKYANSIASGNLEITTNKHRNDELGELQNAFDNMRHSLVESNNEINQLAYYDALTGLPNRATFTEKLEAAINNAKRTETPIALLFVDLDNFKDINDCYGHQTGDLLLRQVSDRLHQCLRNTDAITRQQSPVTKDDNDLIVRLGGDEFTILMTGLSQAHQASILAQRIVDKLSQNFILGEVDAVIGASVGIALYPVDGETSDQLIKHADIAMYEAKKQGKNKYQFFTGAMNTAVAKRLEVEQDLRKAIEENQFELYYQPRVHIKNNSVHSFEALIRWNHPEKGMISPGVFIPIAEESGLIREIGAWVLDEGVRQTKVWLDQGHTDILVSVNMSPVQLASGDPVRVVKATLDKYKLPSKHFEIEITESLLMQDESKSVSLLQALKSLGITIALDDFGTGYSSLAYLRRFPIDVLKIDRSFIIDLEDDHECQVIVEYIISLAKRLKLLVVVEGVETPEQLEFIQNQQCEYVQGYIFSPPIIAREAEKFLSPPGSKDSPHSV